MLVLPAVDGPLLSQEIVYTAITRARRRATVVGRRALLEAALARRSERDTYLPTLLSERFAGGMDDRERGGGGQRQLERTASTSRRS
jgi:hypothetical protein